MDLCFVSGFDMVNRMQLVLPKTSMSKLDVLLATRNTDIDKKNFTSNTQVNYPLFV